MINNTGGVIFIFQNNTLSVNQDEVRNACYTVLNYSLRVVDVGLFAKSV